jgi:hypothetical protein
MELIWIAIIGFVALMGLAMFIYSLPAERFKRKRVTPPPPVKEKDWEEISKRREKNNALLANEIESLKRERKTLLEQIEDGKKIVQEQLEQLAREKAWREKEGLMVEKVKNVDHELKEELRKAQNTLNEEHTVKLRLDIELQENEITIARFKEEVRAQSVRLLALEREAEANNKEIRELKRTNAELKKQREDIQWVAKTDYDLVMMRCRKLESEVSRMTRDQNPQPSSERSPVQPPEKVPQQVSEPISEGVLENPPEQISEQLPEKPLEQSPEPLPEKIDENPSEQSSAQAPEQIVQQSQEKSPEQISKQLPEKPLEQVLEPLPEKVLENLQEQSLEPSPVQSAEQTPTQIPEKVPEQPSVQPPEKVPEQVSERPPEKPLEESPEPLPEKVLESLPEKPSDQSPEKNPHKAPEKNPES